MMTTLPIFAPVSIKMYPTEAVLLRSFVFELGKNAHRTLAHAPVSHFVLYDWLMKSFYAESLKVEVGKKKTVNIPVSVCMLLVQEMTGTFIHPVLQNVLSGLHKNLVNRNLLQ